MKPTVFNYQEYERVVEENKKLNAEVADLRIRCRIADGDKRDCKSCKHQKPDGCSRWKCEYVPVMSDLIKKSDAIKALYKYNFVSKNVIEREINAIPSVEPPYQYSEAYVAQIRWERDFLQDMVNNMAEQKTGEWIPVSERLPEKNGCYLVSTTGENNYIIDIAFYIEGMWHKASRIKAWMPLPEPYREDGAE